MSLADANAKSVAGRAISREVPGQDRFKLRLPATSANLGPGFDCLALALALYLEVNAVAADDWSIVASGRGSDICSALSGNLLLDTYRDIWLLHAVSAPLPLALTVRNGIPLGMGCGSSAASRLAGIALASHYAGLGWDAQRMLEEATRLERHPDNAAACCLGGFVASGYGSASLESGDGRRAVQAVSIAPPSDWHALLVLPELPLATTASRAVLPEHYSREAAVYNLQNVSVLVAAFAQGNAQLLRAATGDRLHQPFRGAVCPLLPRLLPLAGDYGILSVTLSGAGSGVLCLLESDAHVSQAGAAIQAAASDRDAGTLPIAELLPCALAEEPALLGVGTSLRGSAAGHN